MRECVTFWRSLQHWQKNYSSASSTVNDKYHHNHYQHVFHHHQQYHYHCHHHQHDLHQQPRCDKKTIATMASDLMFGGGNRADLELIFAIKIYSNPQALSHHGLRPHVWRWEWGRALGLIFAKEINSNPISSLAVRNRADPLNLYLL